MNANRSTGDHGEQRQACHTTCDSMSPDDVFVNVCEAVWPHLLTEYATRKDIRSTCRHGRQLHDRLSTCLTLDLSKMTQLGDTVIRSALSGMLERGSKFRTAGLKLSTEGAGSRLGEQLDTALAACSSPYLTCLTVSGPMRFSPHVASVMAARCAAVTSLMLNCWAEDTGDESSSPEGGESDVVVADAPPRPWEDLAAAGMAWDEGRSLGLIRLLQELGPRLKELAICKADGWRPEALAALRHCRALTKLCIDAGDEDPVELKYQTALLESISQLPQLRDLTVSVYCRPPALPLPAIPARDAISFSTLSALSALTHLHLDTRHYWLQDATEQLMWMPQLLAQHGALAAALRHMPHLVSFESTTLSLSVPDLAALTTLTRVELAVLTPPDVPLHQPTAADPTCRDGTDQGVAATGGQPRLVKLSTHDDWLCSPRVLARLDAFPFLRELRLRRQVLPRDMYFSTMDVVPGGTHLRPDSAHLVRQAVRVMADVRARGQEASRLGGGGPAAKRHKGDVVVDAESFPGLLLPPAPAPFPSSRIGGHAAWLRELGPLGLPGQWVQLRGLELSAGDLAAIADAFPDAKALDLRRSRVPMAALPCLGRMRQLQWLLVDLRQGGAESAEALCSALYATCLCCMRLDTVEVVGRDPGELQGLFVEVQWAVEDSGRGQVLVVACRS